MEEKKAHRTCNTCNHQHKFAEELRRFEKHRGEKRYTGVCTRKDEISLTHNCWSCPFHWAQDEKEPEDTDEDFV